MQISNIENIENYLFSNYFPKYDVDTINFLLSDLKQTNWNVKLVDIEAESCFSHVNSIADNDFNRQVIIIILQGEGALRINDLGFRISVGDIIKLPPDCFMYNIINASLDTEIKGALLNIDESI